MNPDGFVHSREASPVYNPALNNNLAFEVAGLESGWRKNKRSLTDALYAAGGISSRLNADAHGTDPNRNYPFFWGGEGGRAATRPARRTAARGPSAEPESAQHRVGHEEPAGHGLPDQSHLRQALHAALGLHHATPSPDDAFQEALGERMCEFHGYKNQIGLSLYPTAGTSRDWSYGALRTIVYTFEHSQVPPDVRGGDPVKTYAMNRPAWLLLAEAAADPRYHGVITGGW